MSDPQPLGGLPKVADHDGAVHVFPSLGGKVPLAGPFASLDIARWWVVEHLEQSLTPTQQELWQRVMHDHTPSRDAGLELGLIDMVKHGRTWEQMVRYVPRKIARGPDRRHVPDRRELAAGERA